jgi:polyribonucleotide nucleotidyltransferase
MDIKVGGVSIAMMREALAQARKARLQILDTMEATIHRRARTISTYAPHLHMLQHPHRQDSRPDRAGRQEDPLDHRSHRREDRRDGRRQGARVCQQTARPPKPRLKMIRDVTATAEMGKTYLGTVVRIAEFGAFVEIFPGTDGLLHISEIADTRIRAVRDELKEGDQVLVKVLAIEGNKIRLSRKAVLKEQRDKMAKAAPAAAAAPEPTQGNE